MKKLALMLFLPAFAWAQSDTQFSIGGTEYILLGSSVRADTASGVFYVVALWDVRSPSLDVRWTAYTSGCSELNGEIAVSGERYFSRNKWSWDGRRAYDQIAAYSCLEYFYRQNQRKK